MNIYKLFLAVIILLSNISFAQDSMDEQNIEELSEIYQKFEESYKNNDIETHSDLYLHKGVPVNIIAKTGDGPKDYYSINAQFFMNYFANIKEPHELKIIDPKFEIIANGVAISIADFQGTLNNENTNTGKDVFAYINTDKGWKFAALHNTVVLKEDTNDYSMSYNLQNKIEDIPQKFSDLVKAGDRYGLLELFHEPLAPYISFKTKFEGEFNYPMHSAGGLITNLTRNDFDISLTFENLETRIIDQYIGIATMDYTFNVNGNTRSSGKHVWVLYATADKGWKISSILSSRK